MLSKAAWVSICFDLPEGVYFPEISATTGYSAMLRCPAPSLFSQAQNSLALEPSDKPKDSKVQLIITSAELPLSGSLEFSGLKEADRIQSLPNWLPAKYYCKARQE